MKRDFEDQLEAAYWSFDDIIKNHKGTSHRDAFKQACRQHLKYHTPPDIAARLEAAGWRQGVPAERFRKYAHHSWQSITAIYDQDCIIERFEAVYGHKEIMWSRPIDAITGDYYPAGWETK